MSISGKGQKTFRIEKNNVFCDEDHNADDQHFQEISPFEEMLTCFTLTSRPLPLKPLQQASFFLA